MNNIKLLTLFVVFLFAGNLFARERIRLEMYDQQFRGESTIGLKREMRRQGLGGNLRNLRPIAVKVIAKSRMGRGRVVFQVGQERGQSEMINGNRYDWEDNRRDTYDRIRLEAPYGRVRNNGPWQLHLRGNIKVKRIVVIVEQTRPRDDRFVLNFHGRQFRGQEQMIPLKRELKRQYPELNLQRFELESVRLVAKSKRGRGTVALRVGQNTSYPEDIYGTPHDFHTEEEWTYDTIMLNDTGYGETNGRWQLLLNGNIKISKIVINVRPKRYR